MINTDVIVLSTPEIAGLPYVISGLVAAGGLAAALSTADGLLLAIANALSHDVYYKMIDPNAPTMRRLTVARALLVVVAVIAAATAATKPADILAMVGWAFSLAGRQFPALVMGVWWKRATKEAVCGIIAGFGLSLFYLVITRYSGLRCPVFRHELVAQSGDGRSSGRYRKSHGVANAMEGSRHSPTVGQQGRWFGLTNIASACSVRRSASRSSTSWACSAKRLRRKCGLCGRIASRGQDSARGEDHLGGIARNLDKRGPSGPRLFVDDSRFRPCREVRRLPLVRARNWCAPRPVCRLLSPRGATDLGYCKFVRHLLVLPSAKFILAALMYTLLGRPCSA